MIAASTNAARSAFSGGAYNPSSNPLAVDGSVDLFRSVSTPPAVTAPQTALARNNRGTNVTIPYARLVNTSSKKKLKVTFHNPFFPEPLSANRQREITEPSGIVEGDVVWNLLQESPLDRRGTRPGGEISSKPQRMCSLAFASAAWREAVVASADSYDILAGKFKHSITNVTLTREELQEKIAETFLWDPDGIVLSTSEDTADFGSMDSSTCNLVNVCVQGPAVTKAWSGGADLQTKAGDTLLLIAVIGYATRNSDPNLLVVDPENTYIRPMTNRSFAKEKTALLENPTLQTSSFAARGWRIGKVLDSAASKIGGVMAKKRGRAPVAVKCAVSLKAFSSII